MNRASPVDLRKAMEASQTFLKAGLRFVPMPVLNERDFNDLVKQCDSRLTLIEQYGESADDASARYFVNARTRMCKVLLSLGPDHEANIRQTKREEFVEVTGDLMALFQADTQKAKDAGWKPFGRTSYAKFMERLSNE
jgi:hypothetical protein